MKMRAFLFEHVASTHGLKGAFHNARSDEIKLSTQYPTIR